MRGPSKANNGTSGTRLYRAGHTLLLLFTVANGVHPAPFQASSSNPVASIHGVVLNATNEGGLRKAFLRLAPAFGSGNDIAYTAVTNDQGAFTIKDVAPGSYRLEAECIGFLNAQYGGGSPENAGIEFRLSAGEDLKGIKIKMTPQAVLAGRVLDPDGDAWPHAGLSILHSVWHKGKQRIEAASTSDYLIDDRGEFRIAALAPGRYYLLAVPDAEWERQHHPNVNGQPAVREQPAWYPSSSSIEASVPITLAAGQETSGVEIRLRRGTGSSFHIRGNLAGRETIPAPKGAPRIGQLHIWAQRVSTMLDVDESISGRLGPNGSFEIAAVPSGTYDVSIAQGFPTATRIGHATVQVDDRDVDDLVIELHPPQALRVSVQIEGNEPAKAPRVPITLEPVDFFGYLDPFPVQKDDGSLEFDDLGFARYRVNVQPSVRGQVYLKFLRYGSVESHDGTFGLDSYGIPLELEFSTRGARLSGTVSGQPDIATPPRVVLIPDTADNARRKYQTRSAVFDQNGTFTIEGIAPGAYKLYAFEDVPDGIWLATDFLKEIENSGVAVDAAEGDAINMKVPLLGKTETGRILAKLGFN